jgi:phospholipid transport system substrate-binding protein
MRRLVVVALLAVLASSPYRPASAASAAESLIQELSTRAIGVLSDSGLNASQRRDELRPLFDQYLDLPFIARFVLGQQWRPLDDKTRSNYTTAFEHYVTTLYAKRLGSYSGETLNVVGSRSLNDRDTLVNTQMSRKNGPPVAIDWRVREEGSDGKVIDVVVEGVSMVISQREEFATYLQRKSVDQLIERLKSDSEI